MQRVCGPDSRLTWFQLPERTTSGSNCLSGRNFIRMIPKPTVIFRVINLNHQLASLLAPLYGDCLFPLNNSMK